MDTTYEAIARLTQLKADYGLIASEAAQAQIERINTSMIIEQMIDELVEKGQVEKIKTLERDIDRVNNFSTIEHEQIKGEPQVVGLRYFNVLWQILKELWPLIR